MRRLFALVQCFLETRFGLGATVFALLLLATAEAQARYASIVIDADTGVVLHETNADTRNYPASLVKMMTLYLAFEALDSGRLTLDQKLTVSRRAAGMPAARLGLKKGQTITVKDAILALVIKSANDAAVVVAEALASRETSFARVMSKKARALGMNRTSFRNASGLPNRRQLSTARDLATLARALIRDFPQYYHFFKTKTFRYRGRTHRNHNRLLRTYAGADGIKTGYIRASGFNLVASVVRDGRRLIAVVLGGRTPRSRDRHVAKLLDRSFAKLASRRIERLPGPPRRKPVSIAAATSTAADPAAPRPAEPEPEVAPAEMGSAEDPSPAEAWGIQVGAYYRFAPAQRAALDAAQRVPELLSKTRVKITHIKGRRGRIYRARLVGLSEARARKACRRLVAARIDCLVVQVKTALAAKEAAGRIAVN
ncbi:MAG: D-alanyl-D-alanine carboxypeptidase family protein [Kiloniellaceae bacterium]